MLAYFTGMPEVIANEFDRRYEAEEFFGDLIESADLAGIITGEAQKLAYLWLAANHQGIH